MRLGLAHLRLSPEAFWAMTPRELASMMPARTAEEAPDPGRLAALMQLYPDERPHG